MRIDLTNLADMALGCTVMAGGGGGDPRIGQLMAEEAIGKVGAVEVLPFSALSDEDLIMPCGMIGAPTVMVEKFPNGAEGRVIRDAYEDYFRRPVKAVMPFEMGGINGILPVAWAAYAGLPLLDGDFMGRAFPELQMLTPHLFGMSGSPAVITDERLQTIIYKARDNVLAGKAGPQHGHGARWLRLRRPVPDDRRGGQAAGDSGDGDQGVSPWRGHRPRH